ncbi:hypothetical protein FACS1894205_1190 [Alphaproteobacteria bacterium]|nr:hypothetical protein FACS1894205_1190 [Alphaproteobacteria bacterium]
MKESEAARLTVYEGQRLAGEKVYFWGSGQTYDKYKIFFAQTRPQAILFDLCGDMPDSIDGIPILHPDVVLEKREKHPIVVFSKKEFNKIIIDKIIKKYPSYGRNDIVLAVPSFGQDDFKLHKIDETLDTSHLHEFRDKTS